MKDKKDKSKGYELTVIQKTKTERRLRILSDYIRRMQSVNEMYERLKTDKELKITKSGIYKLLKSKLGNKKYNEYKRNRVIKKEFDKGLSPNQIYLKLKGTKYGLRSQTFYKLMNTTFIGETLSYKQKRKEERFYKDLKQKIKKRLKKTKTEHQVIQVEKKEQKGYYYLFPNINIMYDDDTKETIQNKGWFSKKKISNAEAITKLIKILSRTKKIKRVIKINKIILIQRKVPTTLKKWI